jgi:hypothetical protein
VRNAVVSTLRPGSRAFPQARLRVSALFPGRDDAGDTRVTDVTNEVCVTASDR